jgi:hypothetical protein
VSFSILYGWLERASGGVYCQTGRSDVVVSVVTIRHLSSFFDEDEEAAVFRRNQALYGLL